VSTRADLKDTEPRLRAVAGLLVALAASPAAWALQLVAGYGLSSYACFSRDAAARQSPPPGWAAEPAILLAVNLVCLGIAAAAAVYCLRSLGRRTGNGGAARDVRAVRTRFLAHCGVMAGLIFAGAILVNTANIVMAPTCWSIPR
jgi:hypothetical protein